MDHPAARLCRALPPPAPSAGWRGPFSGARSFQKPTRRHSLLPPLPYLPALTEALSLSFSTSQGLGNRARDLPTPLRPISQPRATHSMVDHPSWSSQACETHGGGRFTDEEAGAGRTRAPKAPRSQLGRRASRVPRGRPVDGEAGWPPGPLHILPRFL